MSFLQPWMLWGLLAAALPIVIHLLNRLRFRSVKWGAMMFLIKAARSSTRNSRLRQYLILACRTLAVLAFAVMLCRPLGGGWVGSLLAGAPDTVIVLLDRSASMETVDPRVQKSKRERVLALLAGVPAETVAGSHIVLIDSALRTPQEVAGLPALPALPQCGPTDTAADMPGLFRAAVEYMLKQKTGRTEIWVASDLQASNWMPERREWSTISAQLAAMQRVKVRVLAMPEGAKNNRTVMLREVAVRRVSDSKHRISLALEFAQSAPEPASVPATLKLDGAPSSFDVAMPGPRLELTKKIEVPADRLAAGGWGRVDLPADENGRDNMCYFVYGSQAQLRGLVVASDAKAGDLMSLASAPSPALNRVCDRLPASAAANVDYEKLAFVVWQGAAPAGAAAEKLKRFVSAGGVVLFLPPSDGVAAAVAPDALVAWGGAEAAEKMKPYRVALWDDLDGPLAKTANGRSLPVARLESAKRCVFAAKTEAGGVAAGDSGWHALATYVDGKPFLLRRALGNGRMYAVTSLPVADWSNLGEGVVLVPMVQRMLEQGGKRLSGAETATCGEWSPPDNGEVWNTVAESGGGRDYRTQAGVYVSGTRRLALNRPAAEDAPDFVAKEKLPKLLGSVPVTVTESLAAEGGSDLQSELWAMFVLFALLFLLAESALLLGEHVPKPAETKKI